MLIVNHLYLVCVLMMDEIDETKKGLRNFHVYIDPSIGGIAEMLCCFCYSDEDAKGIFDAFENFLQLEFLRE